MAVFKFTDQTHQLQHPINYVQTLWATYSSILNIAGHLLCDSQQWTSKLRSQQGLLAVRGA